MRERLTAAFWSCLTCLPHLLQMNCSFSVPGFSALQYGQARVVFVALAVSTRMQRGRPKRPKGMEKWDAILAIRFCMRLGLSEVFGLRSTKVALAPQI